MTGVKLVFIKVFGDKNQKRTGDIDAVA